MDVFDLLAPLSSERILLLGWGDGEPAQHLMSQGHEVVGIDTGIERVVAARRRGLDARIGDAHHLSFDAEFDAVISLALHWIKRADAVLGGVWRALRPGGRFVAEACAGEKVSGVVAALAGALRRRGIDPSGVLPRSFHFPSAAACRVHLEMQGFRVEHLFTRPAVDTSSWLPQAGRRALAALPVGERPDFLAEVQAQLQHLDRDSGTHRVRFLARRPPVAMTISRSPEA